MSDVSDDRFCDMSDGLKKPSRERTLTVVKNDIGYYIIMMMIYNYNILHSLDVRLVDPHIIPF